MKPLVYIAAPYTKGCPVRNTRAAMDMFIKLLNTGLFTPYVPHLSMFVDLVHPLPYLDWLRFDFDIILHCDAILRLEGESSGADQEEAFAKKNAIPVFHSFEALTAWAEGGGG